VDKINIRQLLETYKIGKAVEKKEKAIRKGVEGMVAVFGYKYSNVLDGHNVMTETKRTSFFYGLGKNEGEDTITYRVDVYTYPQKFLGKSKKEMIVSLDASFLIHSTPGVGITDSRCNSVQVKKSDTGQPTSDITKMFTTDLLHL